MNIISEILIHKSNCVAKGIGTKDFNKYYRIINCPYCHSEFAAHVKEIETNKDGSKVIECISCHKNINFDK